MSSDLSDLPPFAESLLSSGEVLSGSVLSVVLPARPGSAKARLSNLAEPVRVSRDFLILRCLLRGCCGCVVRVCRLRVLRVCRLLFWGG